MFSIGEHIIHPGQGVCKVIGFEGSPDSPDSMIVLQARQGHTLTRLLYPMAQCDRLHPCVSREEAERLIDGYGSMACDPFTERNSSLEETHFKQELKQGAPSTVRVAKTMRRRIHDAESHGKRPSSYCLRILKEADRRVLEELAVALECSEDDVQARFQAIMGNGDDGTASLN